MGPQFPTSQGLAQSEFLPAYAFQQQREQTNLANQFAQQEMLQKKAELEAKMLENLFNQQNNPQKVKQQGLINSGMETKNEGDRASLDEWKGPDATIARRNEYIAKANENQLKMIMSQAQADMMNPDPKVSGPAKDMYMRSATEVAARQRNEEDMGKIRLQGENSARVANIGAGATLGAARINADARMQAAAGKNKDLITSLLGKPPATQYAAYTALAQRAVNSGDYESAREFGLLAESVKAQVEQGLMARSDPNAVSATGVTGLPGQTPVQLPTNPYVGGQPQQRPAAPQPQARPQQGGRVSVVSPDGKTGSIPADQLEQALKNGFKQR